MNPERKLAWDWFPGAIPTNVAIDDTAYLETTFSFQCFRSQLPCGLEIGRGASTYLGTMFDVGPKGCVKLGKYAMIHGARIICDDEILIGDYALISWNVVLMDSYRIPLDLQARRRELEQVSLHPLRIFAANVQARPIHIERNVWLGFDCGNCAKTAPPRLRCLRAPRSHHRGRLSRGRPLRGGARRAALYCSGRKSGTRGSPI